MRIVAPLPIKTILFLLFAMMTATACRGVEQTEKPLSPLVVTLAVLPGESSDLYLLTATLTTQVEMASVSLTVNLPPSMVLIEGASRWQGTLPVDTEQRLELKVRTTVQGELVTVEARREGDGSRLMARDSVRLGGATLGITPAPEGRPRQRDGRDVVEYPLN